MKEVKTYIAFDNTVFDKKEECLAYEKENYLKEAERIHRRLQQLKSGELSELFKRYRRAKENYRKVCTEKTDGPVRASATATFFNIKEIYRKALVEYSRMRKRYNLMKDKDKVDNLN